MVGGSSHASAQAIFWQLKDKRWGVGGVYPFYCLFLPITAPPVPRVTWSDERVLGVGVHGGGHEATTLKHSVRRQDWKASQVEGSQWTHKSPLSQAGDAFGHKYTFTTMAGAMATIF